MKLLAVDGNNLLMRAVKALQYSPKPMSAMGVPTGAVHAFIGSLSRYVREIQPDSMIVCWDGGKSEYRRAVFPEYKAQRSEPSAEELADKESTFELAKQFLSFAGIHHVEVLGYEADDLIAYYWQHIRRDEMVILSGDKDLLQLVDSTTTQIRPGKGDDEVWDEARVIEAFGCTAEQWGLVLALQGDTIDGVPGVPRVGPKTAIKDLAAAGWQVEGLAAVHDRYVEHADIVERNLKLVVLRDTMATIGLTLPDPPPFSPTVHESVLWNDLLAWLDHYELQTIRDRLMRGELW